MSHTLVYIPVAILGDPQWAWAQGSVDRFGDSSTFRRCCFTCQRSLPTLQWGNNPIFCPLNAQVFSQSNVLAAQVQLTVSREPWFCGMLLFFLSVMT